MAQRFYLFAKLRLYRTRAKGTEGTAQRNDAMLYGRWDWAVSESGAGTGTETGVSSWGLASTGVIKTLAQVRARGEVAGKAPSQVAAASCTLYLLCLSSSFHTPRGARG